MCAVIFGALIKKSNQEYAVLVCMAGCTVILLAVLEQAGPLVAELRSLTDAEAFPSETLGAVFRAVGIAVAGQLVSRVCKDAGESALSYTVELAAKVAILSVSLPLLLRLFSFLGEIVEL